MRFPLHPILKEFERYSTYFRHGKRSVLKAPQIPFFQELTGIPNLLGTFSIALRHDLYKEEWNPFSQRQLILNVAQAKDSFSVSFQALEDSLRSLLLSIHEALHVALWEPFFVGKMTISGREQFKSLSLCFEAFCFWYADIIATPQVRQRFPDNEFTFERNAISDAYFHPSRVFAALGIADTRKMLDVYMAAFCGQQSALSKPKDIFSFNLGRRICQFHLAAKTPVFAFYAQLADAGIFSVFRERFCAIHGLPSLFPEELNASLAGADPPFQYCRDVYRKGLSFLAGRSKIEITRVRLRRNIQSKAYFAFVLQKVLRDGNFISLKRSHGDLGKGLLSATETYLSKLEAALKELCGDAKPAVVAQHIEGADRSFSEPVVNKAKAHEMWVARRTSILPPADQAFVTGLLGRRKLSREARVRAAERLRKHLGKALFRGQLRFGPEGIDEIARLLPDLMATKANGSRSGRTARATNEEFIAVYNQIVSHPSVIREWSAPLYAIDPARDSFKELLFLYV